MMKEIEVTLIICCIAIIICALRWLTRIYPEDRAGIILSFMLGIFYVVIKIYGGEKKVKIVEKTIEDLCRLVQKKTENCKESYEVNELAELTKALAELITARAQLG